MFAAMREGLGNFKYGMRTRRTLGLFVFEFFVVVLGVLAAQGVQEFIKQREQQRHTNQELERLGQAYVSTQQNGAAWRAAIPCLRARVESLMRAAAADTPVRPEAIRRPRMIATGYLGTDVETAGQIEAILGVKKTIALLDVQSRAVNMDESMGEMRARWEKFRLLDPSYGPVSAADRTIAREAGVDILMHMRNLEIAIINVEERSPDLLIADKTPPIPGVDTLPVSSCAQLWADGTAYRLAE
jgi:hypothetical protein